MSLFIEIKWRDGSEEAIQVPDVGISQLTDFDIRHREWLVIIDTDNRKHSINLDHVRSFREVSK